MLCGKQKGDPKQDQNVRRRPDQSLNVKKEPGGGWGEVVCAVTWIWNQGQQSEAGMNLKKKDQEGHAHPGQRQVQDLGCPRKQDYPQIKTRRPETNPCSLLWWHCLHGRSPIGFQTVLYAGSHLVFKTGLRELSRTIIESPFDSQANKMSEMQATCSVSHNWLSGCVEEKKMNFGVR